MARVGPGPLSLGLGETLTNIEPAKPAPDVKSRSRSEGVDAIARLRFAQSAASGAYLQLRLNPYVHIDGSTTYNFPGRPASTVGSVAHGARVDVTLGRELYVKRFTLGYGLRYINQTTNYGPAGPSDLLTRTTSLMPFVAVSLR